MDIPKNHPNQTTEIDQRRAFFRQGCLLPFKYRTEDPPGTLQDGVIIELGGGGMRFTAYQELKDHARLKSVISLDALYLILTGVVRQKKRKAHDTFEYRIQFFDMAQQDEERIVQFVLEEQRKALQKKRDQR
jgi:c-di-GMP-binding flagellar brake protein YcgR